MALTCAPAVGPTAGGQAVTCTVLQADIPGVDLRDWVPIGQVTVTFDAGGGNPQLATNLVAISAVALTCTSPAHAAGAVTVQMFVNTGD